MSRTGSVLVVDDDAAIRAVVGQALRRAGHEVALVASLAEHAPHIELTGLAAGFHAVAHLPAGADEEQVVARALNKQVRLYGMSRYRSDFATTPPQLVFGFGNTNVRAIQKGIRLVGPLLR